MSAFHDAVLRWANERLDALLAAPPMWGSNEAVEMQALLLLELRALTLRPDESDAVFERYAAFLRRRFPGATPAPLCEIEGAPFEATLNEFRRLLDQRLLTQVPARPQRGPVARTALPPRSGLRDNYSRGTVANFLREKIQGGSDLSIVSAYFTIYAYDGLKQHLEQIDRLRFLFGEPTFVARLDPSKTEKKAFIIDPAGLQLANKLQQKRVARECADWISRKVSIKTIRQSNLLHGKMYRVANGEREDALLGSSNFTVRGLGLAESGNNLELNLELDRDRDRADLRAWFEEFKDKLAGRDQAETGIRYEWYALARPRKEIQAAFEGPKIVYPNIYEHQSFAWDGDGCYAANTCYFISTEEKWLTGLLNSATVEWFYGHLSNRIRGGYLRAFSDYMQQIPIPKADTRARKSIEDRVARATAARKRDPEAFVADIEAEIDGLVAQLYGLTEDEYRFILEDSALSEPVRMNAINAYREHKRSTSWWARRSEPNRSLDCRSRRSACSTSRLSATAARSRSRR